MLFGNFITSYNIGEEARMKEDLNIVFANEMVWVLDPCFKTILL